MTSQMLLLSAAFIFSGCSAFEQYHYPAAFSEVPSSAKVAFGDKHPTDELKMNEVMVQKMYDGAYRYHFISVTRKGEQHEVVISSDGNEM